jgi:hypothetical protein
LAGAGMLPPKPVATPRATAGPRSLYKKRQNE